jgi:hypothetical protein
MLAYDIANTPFAGKKAFLVELCAEKVRKKMLR